MLIPSFTNICFVPEDEPPIRSIIKRVQDLDLSDYTAKDSLNLEEYQEVNEAYVQEAGDFGSDGKLKENDDDKLSYASVNTVDSTPE